MNDFRTFTTNKRVPAVAMQPLIDPAGWTAAELSDVSTWSYRITDRDIAELADGVAAFRRSGRPIAEVRREEFPLHAFADVLRDVRRELLDGRGIVMMQNFPVEEFDREATAIGYLGMGTYLGNTMVQNKHGHVLGHVKDLGGDYEAPTTRGYTTNAEMRFHCDGCDYVGLLCLKTSKNGGESRVASSVTLYNRMLERRPDLALELTRDFYRSRSGDIGPRQLPYFPQPIFSFVDGFFSATGIGKAIDKGQKLPGVPRFTPAQKEAVQLYRDLAEELAVDIAFAPGDIQFLNNFVTLHTRRGYQDWPEASRKRHLLRLWLTDPEGRIVPKAQREGRAGKGIQIEGVKTIAPLEAEVA